MTNRQTNAAKLPEDTAQIFLNRSLHPVNKFVSRVTPEEKEDIVRFVAEMFESQLTEYLNTPAPKYRVKPVLFVEHNIKIVVMHTPHRVACHSFWTE